MQLSVVSIFLCVVASHAAPATFDQRQDGKVNVHAKLENILILVAPPAQDSSSSNGIDFVVPGLLEALEFRKNLAGKLDVKNVTKNEEVIEIPTDTKNPQLLKETRTLDGELLKKKIDRIESKLIGDAIENCGPGRHRDYSGICQSDIALFKSN